MTLLQDLNILANLPENILPAIIANPEVIVIAGITWFELNNSKMTLWQVLFVANLESCDTAISISFSQNRPSPPKVTRQIPAVQKVVLMIILDTIGG